MMSRELTRVLRGALLAGAAAAVLLSPMALREAHAGATAYSYLETQGLVLSRQGTTLDFGDFSSLTVTTQLSTNVLGALGSDGDLQTVPTGPNALFDVNQACAGSACAGNPINDNTFSQVGSGEFVRADAQSSGAAITGIPGVSAGANAVTVADTRLNGGPPPAGDTVQGTGAVNPVITTFTFSLVDPGVIDINFTALLEASATLNPDAIVPPSQSTAQTVFIITIEQDGIANPIQTIQPTELNVTVNNGQPTTEVGGGFGGAGQAFSLQTVPLLAGVEYVATINHQSIVSATKAVPEPGSLALLGTGLLGLGFFYRRRRRAQR